MKRQNGFTLVELVVVIVILGILAVTAAPKFLNLQEDARKASIQGLKGAMDSAAGIVYGKAALEGLDTSPSGTLANTNIAVSWGYPAPTAAGIGNAVEGLQNDWTMVGSLSNPAGDSTAGTPGYITFSFKNSPALHENCYATYHGATASAGPRTETKCGVADSNTPA